MAPLLWTSSFAQTLLSQAGIAIIACLAYNLLLGQTGMLSFGHAVYSGLGGFMAMHALRLAGAGELALPVSLIPLVGGAAGLVFAALLGGLTTRRSGTAFAMITLGVAELVGAVALMVPEVFGGEGGVSGNRVVGPPRAGITFGPQIEVYGLIAVYCFICTALLYALTRTPLGRMFNAVRDNPERVEFIGYDAHRLRYQALMISGFFAGIAGGLGALNFEIVTAEALGSSRSGAYLLFVLLGGTTVFIGPIIGAVLMVLALVLLSALTRAWLLYLGLVFVLMMTVAPGGIASLLMANLRLAAFGKLRRLLPAYSALAAAAAVFLTGATALIEMLYHRQLDAALGSNMTYLGLPLDVQSAFSWSAALALLVIGAGLLNWQCRGFSRDWAAIADDIEREIGCGPGGLRGHQQAAAVPTPRH